MRRHKQTIPDTGHCLTLSEMAEGPGAAGMTEAEQLERIAIENRHGNDDGTDWFFRRAIGGLDAYRDSPDPITDDSPVVALCDCGLNAHDLNQLERHDCATVADVRECLANRDIPAWRGCGLVMERHVREAVERIGGS